MLTPSSDERLVVVWRITQACDLRCAYCGYSRALKRARAEADPCAVLAWGRVLSDYARRAGRDVLVSWLGGEPLRWPPLLDLARIFRQDYGLSLSVTTNGVALSSEHVRRRLVADFSEVTVSLDGRPELHDRLRQSPGLYHRVRDSIERLRELMHREGGGPRLRLNTVLMRDNVYEFEALCKTAAGWGIEALTFNALGGRDRPEFYPDHRLLPEHVAWLREALPGIRARAVAVGLTICGSERYLERLTASAAGRARPMGTGQSQGCRAGETFLFVDEQGRVSPCSHTSETYGYPLAELGSPEAVGSLPERWARDRQRHLAAACSDCLSTQVFGKFWC
jgi:MoaA/NifB/PqqE/SkfB family radical SAM enzyme